MSGIDAVLYEYVKEYTCYLHGSFLFSGFNRFMHFMSTYANSWIKIAARQNIIWIRFGNRRAVRRRRAEAGMALTAIGEITQWGGVAGCSGSRTYVFSTTQRWPNKIIKIFLIEDFFHLPPVLLTPVANIELRISPRIFEKIRNGLNGILWGWGETDSWTEPEAKNLVTLSL